MVSPNAAGRDAYFGEVASVLIVKSPASDYDRARNSPLCD
jgi:hypothetical protein